MKKLDHHLQFLVDKGNSPSVSYLLFDKNEIIHSYRSGYSDIIREESINENTTYCGFSVTKTFTALAILQLAEKGKLALEDHANNYMNFPYSEPITIKQLLSHSAGVPNPLPLRWVHSPEEHLTFDRKQFFENIFQKNKRLKSAPNEKYKYSNLGYVHLGQIIEQVSGLSYEEYIRVNIIEPLGMAPGDLGFQIRDHRQHAKGYQKIGTFMNFLLGFLMDKQKYVNQKEGRWYSFRDTVLNGPSHGGLVGKPSSLMRYIQELLKDDCVLITDDFKRLLFTENITNSGKKTAMCLSWFKGDLNGNSYFCHAGGGAGYYCEIRIYPERGVGSVIMLNRSGMTDERVLSGFDKFYFENESQD
ncbi:MAG: serine hydrolase domain-containing protein [Bacteroidota bacterium]